MSNKPAQRPLRLPPADLAQEAVPRLRLPARGWCRLHPMGRKAIYFSLNSAHRFSHSNCPSEILYLGADPETCLWERFGDVVFDDDHRIARTLWIKTGISTIHVPF